MERNYIIHRSKFDNEIIKIEGSCYSVKKIREKINKEKETSEIDHLYKKHLRTFGEVGIVPLKTGEQIKAKLNDRGTACIFLGYVKKHAGNVYQMLNMKTNAVIVTRDV
jgi:hypothetical protein